MKKNFKVITVFCVDDLYIENFETLEAAFMAYNKAVESGCDVCYLLETEVGFQCSGDSFNRIISKYTKK